jgi:hypothetical protein
VLISELEAGELLLEIYDAKFYVNIVN